MIPGISSPQVCTEWHSFISHLISSNSNGFRDKFLGIVADGRLIRRGWHYPNRRWHYQKSVRSAALSPCGMLLSGRNEKSGEIMRNREKWREIGKVPPRFRDFPPKCSEGDLFTEKQRGYRSDSLPFSTFSRESHEEVHFYCPHLWHRLDVFVLPQLAPFPFWGDLRGRVGHWLQQGPRLADRIVAVNRRNGEKWGEIVAESEASYVISPPRMLLPSRYFRPSRRNGEKLG